MQLIIEDVLIHRFVPDDGTDSAAVKVTHRTERTEAISEETVSPRDNLRLAIRDLMDALNPHPDHIRPAKLFLYDEVTIMLPESSHDGMITKESWNFKTHEWQYFVQCKNHTISAWYTLADLRLFEEA